jgi:hypothetical protein
MPQKNDRLFDRGFKRLRVTQFLCGQSTSCCNAPKASNISPTIGGKHLEMGGGEHPQMGLFAHSNHKMVVTWDKERHQLQWAMSVISLGMLFALKFAGHFHTNTLTRYATK